MKYICLGYIEPGKFERMTEDERNAVFDQYFEHSDYLRQRTSCRRTSSSASGDRDDPVLENGKVTTTDGPYAETKEQLGGISILEARGLNHAIQLL